MLKNVNFYLKEVIDQRCQKWFAMFCIGDILLDDAVNSVTSMKLIEI